MSKNNPLECKLCKVIFKSKSRMMKHLISKKHLENLINITIEPFEILDNETHNSNEVDPFLNKNDINKLKNMDIGDGFDIAYKNNDVVKCEYVFEEKQNVNVQEEPNVIEEKQQQPPVMTEKQSKILDFLIKNQNHQQVANKLFQVLQKLPLEDLKGFSTHIISNDDIQILIKEKIIKVFKIYKETLLKKKENGQTHFNNILIQDIVCLIIV
uniref:C2H2-type domain-containing protein n=1 Tax=viral metagenome TaxID=1070528 RepID=A0A6C0EHS3_9ZZZZ